MSATDAEIQAAYQQYLDDCQRHGCECLALPLAVWATITAATR